MSPKKPQTDVRFPEGFLWGAATAAHQVEGGQHNDWSAWEPSVADELAAGAAKRLRGNLVPDWPGMEKVAGDPQGYISGTAADHYNRYVEDLDLLQSIGCNAYRFSVEWSRIEPKPGQYDQAALDHYKRVVSELRKRRMTPLVTLHHFSNPDWLENLGGWHGPNLIDYFGRFVETVAQSIGRDVNLWCTINEPGSYLFMRYLGGGIWPNWPHLSFNPLQGYAYMRNVTKAHRVARQAIKAVNPDAQLGLAHGFIDFQLARRDPFSWVGRQLLRYIPDGYLLRRLRGDVDYIGVNYYVRGLIKVGFGAPRSWLTVWDGQESRSDMGWGIYPDGLYHVTQQLKQYNVPLIITENGIPDANDAKRASFITDHVAAIDRSVADGANVRGYFYWSLLDNFEWSEGFWPRFGLVSVDRSSQARTVRPSARVYGELIRQYTTADDQRLGTK